MDVVFFLVGVLHILFPCCVFYSLYSSVLGWVSERVLIVINRKEQVWFVKILAAFADFWGGFKEIGMLGNPYAVEKEQRKKKTVAH
jgi:hypothetical protein